MPQYVCNLSGCTSVNLFVFWVRAHDLFSLSLLFTDVFIDKEEIVSRSVGSVCSAQHPSESSSKKKRAASKDTKTGSILHAQKRNKGTQFQDNGPLYVSHKNCENRKIQFTLQRYSKYRLKGLETGSWLRLQ